MPIVARNVCNPAVTNGYHVTILKRALIDLATIDKCSVSAAEIYQVNAGCRIYDQSMMPANQRIGYRNVAQPAAAYENMSVTESLLLHDYAMHSGDEPTNWSARAIDPSGLRLSV